MQRNIFIFVVKEVDILKTDSARQQERTVSAMMSDLSRGSMKSS
jgi:hypothetical protein